MFLTWQDSVVVWQFLSTFILKWVSRMLPLQELFHNQHFSQKNDYLLVPCTLLCHRMAVGQMFLLKGGGLGERRRAEASRWFSQVALPLASDSQHT